LPLISASKVFGVTFGKSAKMWFLFCKASVSEEAQSKNKVQSFEKKCGVLNKGVKF
jgi:hypothetical protein